MPINTHLTTAERTLIANIERARHAGVDIGGECEALYHAIIKGLTYTTWTSPFDGRVIPAAVTDERVRNADDYLFDRAIEQGKCF